MKRKICSIPVTQAILAHDFLTGVKTDAFSIMEIIKLLNESMIRYYL